MRLMFFHSKLSALLLVLGVSFCACSARPPRIEGPPTKLEGMKISLTYPGLKSWSAEISPEGEVVVVSSDNLDPNSWNERRSKVSPVVVSGWTGLAKAENFFEASNDEVKGRHEDECWIDFELGEKSWHVALGESSKSVAPKKAATFRALWNQVNQSLPQNQRGECPLLEVEVSPVSRSAE